MKNIGATLALISILSIPGYANSASEFGDDLGEYQMAVMSILRLHLKAIETLAANQKHPYSENMLRHASALKSSAQLLDHVYPDPPGNRIAKSGVDAPWNDPKSFDAQVEQSLKATKELVKASEQWMKGNREPLAGAIKSVRNSCDSCHKIFRAH